MNKKGDGNAIWYVIAIVLLVVVIAVVLMWLFGYNPFNKLKELIPGYNITREKSDYTGLCLIKQAGWKGYKRSYLGEIKLPAPAVYVLSIKEETNKFILEIMYNGYFPFDNQVKAFRKNVEIPKTVAEKIEEVQGDVTKLKIGYFNKPIIYIEGTENCERREIRADIYNKEGYEDWKNYGNKPRNPDQKEGMYYTENTVIEKKNILGKEGYIAEIYIGIDEILSREADVSEPAYFDIFMDGKELLNENGERMENKLYDKKRENEFKN